MPAVGDTGAASGASTRVDDRTLAAEAVRTFCLQAKGACRADMYAGAAAGTAQRDFDGHAGIPFV